MHRLAEDARRAVTRPEGQVAGEGHLLVEGHLGVLAPSHPGDLDPPPVLARDVAPGLRGVEVRAEVAGQLAASPDVNFMPSNSPTEYLPLPRTRTHFWRVRSPSTGSRNMSGHSKQSGIDSFNSVQSSRLVEVNRKYELRHRGP